MTESKYPEHDKQQLVLDKAHAIGDFLDDLQYKGIRLCYWDTKHNEYMTIDKSFTTILAEHFNIDLNKIEKEKLQMLEEQRELNKK